MDLYGPCPTNKDMIQNLEQLLALPKGETVLDSNNMVWVALGKSRFAPRGAPFAVAPSVIKLPALLAVQVSPEHKVKSVESRQENISITGGFVSKKNEKNKPSDKKQARIEELEGMLAVSEGEREKLRSQNELFMEGLSTCMRFNQEFSELATQETLKNQGLKGRITALEQEGVRSFARAESESEKLRLAEKKNLELSEVAASRSRRISALLEDLDQSRGKLKEAAQVICRYQETIAAYNKNVDEQRCLNKRLERQAAVATFDRNRLRNKITNMLDFDTYQRATHETAVYPKRSGIIYTTLGLSSEAGEVAGKVKKVIRDKSGHLTDADKGEIADEIGDVLWYAARLCHELKIPFGSVARGNLDKLADRKRRDTLCGDGDKR